MSQKQKMFEAQSCYKSYACEKIYLQLTSSTVHVYDV